MNQDIKTTITLPYTKQNGVGYFFVPKIYYYTDVLRIYYCTEVLRIYYYTDVLRNNKFIFKIVENGSSLKPIVY